jgi:arylsulfatase A-like enzyme
MISLRSEKISSIGPSILRISHLKLCNPAELALASLLLLAITSAATAESERPNILFIMADDLGYGDLGCYGSELITTPHIDRLAADGMRFTQCYAGSPVCAPSRSVLMTGLHTGHTTVRGNFGQGGVVGLAGNPGRVPLHDKDLTVAEVLQSAGYATGMTGKWGLGEPGTTGEPLRQGFESWFGFLNQRRAHSHYPEFLWLKDRRFDLPCNTNGKQQQYAHDLFTDYACSFIRDHADRPFFLYLPYTLPHDRLEVPELGAYSERPWSAKEKAYAAMVSRVDADVGRITNLIEELGLAKKTIVFFCSDNGAANRYDGLFDSSAHLRGKKRDLYEGGLRVPMIVRWPQTIPAASTSDQSWTFADVLPTLANIAGVPQTTSTDGVSILPTLLGKTQDLSERFLYWEFYELGFQQAARQGKWKCLRLEEDGPVELYDLDSDPAEANNVASLFADVVSRFEDYLANAGTVSELFPRKKIAGY